LKAAGEQAGVKVKIHGLRHTCGTQLLNAGCPVTSIQKFLGHKKLNTTMVYAHAHDQTVEQDYFAAMSRIEQRLELVSQPAEYSVPISVKYRSQLLTLAEQLFAPEMSNDTRLEIAAQMHGLLVDQSEWIPPPVLKESEITLP
jgi:Phage integrase family